jgi:hypothetical protein
MVRSPSPALDYLREGIFQFAYVTSDFQRGVDVLRRRIAGVRFAVLEDLGFEDHIYRGRATDARIHLALAPIGGGFLEVIQPLSGPSPFDVVVGSDGPLAFHHAAVRVEDLDECRARLASAGIAADYSGRHGDSRFDYVDATDIVGHWIEFIEFGPEGRDLLESMRAAPGA